MSDNSFIFNEIRNITNKVLDGDMEALDKYEIKFPFDTKSSIIRAYLDMKQGQYDQASEKILQFLEENHYNFEIHYIFQKAKKFEEEGRYSLALDMYEMLLALIENYRLKNSIIEKIEELYREFPEKLLMETAPDYLDIKMKNAPKTNFTLHVMTNHFHCKAYIEFIQKNYGLNDHIFLIIVQWNDKDYIKEGDFPNTFFFRFHSWEAHMDYNVKKYILPLIQQASRIIVHQLKDYFCWLVCRYNIKQDLYWFVWGADLYSYINKNNRLMCDEQTNRLIQKIYPSQPENPLYPINLTYRKGFIRRMRGVLTPFYGEYELIKQNYVTGAKFTEYFYPNLIDVTVSEQAIVNNKVFLKSKYEYVFMIGHSGFPSNNHLEVFSQLARYDRNIGIVVPLSYGMEAYIQEIINAGHALFGDRFIPITSYLDPQQYVSILNEVDVAFFNGNRQIGVGNVRLLIQLGKKVYLKPETATFTTLTQNNIDVFDIADLQHAPLESIVSQNFNVDRNKKNIIRLFSIERLKEQHNKLFKQRN